MMTMKSMMLMMMMMMMTVMVTVRGDDHDHDEFVHDIEVHGAGTTNPSKFFWKTLELFSDRLKVPNFMTYRAVGSSTGQKEFVGDYTMVAGTEEEHKWDPMNDWGAGDIPMSSSRYELLTVNASREMVHMPFALGAIAIFHSVPSADLPDGDELDLDACLLAKIFQGNITTWDDQEILNANPNFNPPADQPILMVHRKKGSSSTTGTTEYLSTTCTDWVLGSGSTVDWVSGAEAEGSGGVTAYLKGNPYAIGYLDAGHGHANGLSEVSMLNLNSNQYLKSTDADISTAVGSLDTSSIFPADSSMPFDHVNLYNIAHPQAWPITMVTYLYLQKDMSEWDDEKAGLFKAFVEYINEENGQAALEEFRFTKIPSTIVTYNNETIQQNITWPENMTEFTTEDSTAPWIGAGRYVISSKRRGYPEYDRGQIYDDIEELQTQYTALMTQYDALVAENADLTQNYDDLSASVGSSCGCDDDNAESIAAAAIALACIAVVLSIASLCFANVRKNQREGMDQCTPVGKKGVVEMNGSNGGTV